MEQQTTSKPRIRRLGAYRFIVESKSRPGLGHQVDTLHLRCSCEAGKHQRRCWHLVWALQAEALYKRLEAEHKAKNARPAQAPAATVKAPAAPAAPSIPFEETAGYKALAECFA